MNILIAGASGFIGKELVAHLAQVHTITVLGRSQAKLESIFPKMINKLTWDKLSDEYAKQYDLIINLSGSNISDKRWGPAVKQELLESRTESNKQLSDWLISNKATPRFFCASAVGIYGAHEPNAPVFDEDSHLNASSKDFLQLIGFAWELSLIEALNAGISVVFMRFGVVLKHGGGMLQKLELPFRLGLGSVLATGAQQLSWIYYKDLIKAIDFLIQHPDVLGPVNITSPNPCTQKEFAQALASALHRPLFLKTPAFVVKMMFGEMGDYLILKGQKVIPKRLNQLGFQFDHPTLESVMREEYRVKS